MNAIQARKEAKEAFDKRTDQSLLQIQREIKEAVKKGEFYCYHYDFISEFVRQKLIEQGYILEHEGADRAGEHTFKISW